MKSLFFDRNFFSKPEHPMNLAVFRIVFFASIYFQISWKKILFFSGMPDELRIPPLGLGWLVPYLPISPEISAVSVILLSIFCFTGMIGFYSRISAAMVAILGFYVFGIERFFGDVHHNHHHIIWFSLVLSVSRCGDALSIDAWGKKYAPSTAYTYPIRLIWILMGILYFFPGFWKYYRSGIDWAIGENMKYQMYGKWFWFAWTPGFRIDQYPILYKLSGLGTLFFEIGFIFLLFIPILRYLPIITGFMFHTMTWYFLKVTFWSLLSCYVIFIDWHALFKGKTTSASPTRFNQSPLIVMGICLVSINLFLGFSHQRYCWPFACFPTFENIRGPTRSTQELVFLDANRNQIKKRHRKVYRSKRTRFLIKNALNTKDPITRTERIQGLMTLLSEMDPNVKDAAFLQIYKYRHTVIPDELHRNPIGKELIEEIELYPNKQIFDV